MVAPRVSCPTRHDYALDGTNRHPDDFFPSNRRKPNFVFVQLSFSDGTSKLIKLVRKPRVFHAPNAMPTIIQITPARIAAWLRLSQSRRQMVKPEMGSTRLASLFSELRM